MRGGRRDEEPALRSNAGSEVVSSQLFLPIGSVPRDRVDAARLGVLHDQRAGADHAVAAPTVIAVAEGRVDADEAATRRS